jgi:hypothetical protein
VFLSGLALSIADMKAPADSSFMPSWNWGDPALETALGAFSHAFVPVPRLELHFWNTSILSSLLPGDALPWLEGALAVGFLLASIYTLRGSRVALVYFLLACAAIAAFLSVKYTGFLRHHGHVHLALLSALWIAESVVAPGGRDSGSGVGGRSGADRRVTGSAGSLPKAGGWLLTLILGLHVVASVPAAYFELRYPFSRSEEVADYLRAESLDNEFLVGHFDYATSPVALHLDASLYYPNAEERGSYIVWDSRRYARRVEDIVATVGDLAREHGTVLLIASYPLLDAELPSFLKPLRSFEPAIEASEQYSLYLATPPSPTHPQ